MEQKYGPKFGIAKTLPIAVSGPIMVACVFLVAGVSVIAYSIYKGGFSVVGVVLFLIGALIMAYCVKSLLGNVTCYENAIVITETFKTTVIPRDQIAAIQWQRPGASVSNARQQTNVNKADIIMVGGRQHYTISDGYYSNVEVLGLYQSQYKIPNEIHK